MPDPIEVRADGKAYVIPGLSSSSAAFDTSSSYILQETTSRMSYPVDQADFSKCPKYAEKQGLDMTKVGAYLFDLLIYFCWVSSSLQAFGM
jgi:hypothetical protein